MGVDRAIDITAAQRKIILALLRKHLPNTTAWVYGSRATWNARPQSDLDMVLFATPAQEREVSDLRDAFEESALPFRVDLCVWAAVPESFHKQIEAEHVVLVEKEERGGAGEWPIMSFREAGVSLIDCEHRTPPAVEHGYPYVAIPQVKDGRIDLNGVRRITRDHFDEWTRKANPESFDIVLSRRCNPGETGFVSEGLKFALGQNLVLLRSDGTKVLKPFLRWLVRGPRWWEQVGKYINVGAVFDSLKCADIPDFRLPIPPLPEQRAIAHILGTLDDKIELNRRMNETLEEMARALFKSWFVDFDPVHAKATLKRHAANQAPRQGASTPATEAARSGITPPLRGSRQAKGASPQARRRGEIRRLYSPQTLQKAQALRHNQTDAEGLLWHYLRNKQLDGYKFRRQQPIGPYIADFACLSQKLLIELDGSQHATRQDYDEKRDAFLREKGYRVLRFWNNEVFENCFGVLESIYAVLPHHPPLEGRSKDASLSGRGNPPPQQPSPDGLAAATPPQGGSDWTVERAQAYLDGMDADIAALFPDSFVDSELGPIPAGWATAPLSDHFEAVKGVSYKGSGLGDNGVPLHNLNSIYEGGGYKYEGIKYYSGEYADRHVVHPGDVIVANTEQGHDRLLIGYTAIVPRFFGNHGIVSHHIYRLRPKRDSQLSATFLCFLLNSPWMHDLVSGYANGTTVNMLPLDAVQKPLIVLPPRALVETFDVLALSCEHRREETVQESRTLSALRDTLLPKLMSGELRVKDVERTSKQH